MEEDFVNSVRVHIFHGATKASENLDVPCATVLFNN
jgi:hypothetical protein